MNFARFALLKCLPFKVLKTCTNVTESPTKQNGSTDSSKAAIDANKNDLNLNGIKEKKKSHKLNNSENNHVGPQDQVDSADSVSKPKRQRILEKISYDDLGAPALNGDTVDCATANQNLTKTQQLNLAKVERYLHGPVPIAGEPQEEAQELNLNMTQYQICQDSESWGQRTPHKLLVSATAAVNALGELSPGGALMRGFQEQSLARE